ncbi:MAG: hypothetical protein WCJ40_10460 [Planctomycetota bacterium]
MAKKRSTTVKPTTPATISFDSRFNVTKSPKLKIPNSVKKFIKIFESCGFDCNNVDEDSFCISIKNTASQFVLIHENLRIASINIVLVTLPNVTEAKKMMWMNLQMLNFPLVRITLDQAGIIIASMDYLYMFEVDEMYLMTLVSTLDSIVHEIYSRNDDNILDLDLAYKLTFYEPAESH